MSSTSEPTYQLAPPDSLKQVYLTLAAGFAVGLGIFLLRTNTLPHTGDNIHHLPHGGCYRDGTKSIRYNPPGVATSSNIFLPAIAVLCILALLHVPFFQPNRVRRRCCRFYWCSDPHHPAI
nr:putative triple gene block protein 2 [Lolium latent virus]